MKFTDKEKSLAKELKASGLVWKPMEGDWFWSPEEYAHNFYLGESLPASYLFRKDEAYVFDSSMTWHIQQGGFDIDRLVWLPTWQQCRDYLKEKGYSISLLEENEIVHLESDCKEGKISATGATDLEAIYGIVLRTVAKT